MHKNKQTFQQNKKKIIFFLFLLNMSSFIVPVLASAAFIYNTFTYDGKILKPISKIKIEFSLD